MRVSAFFLLLRCCLSKNLLCYSSERAGHSSGSGLGQLISWPIGHGWKSHVKDLEGLVTFNEQPSLTDLRRSVQPKVTPKKVQHYTHTTNNTYSILLIIEKKTHFSAAKYSQKEYEACSPSSKLGDESAEKRFGCSLW